MSQSRHQDMLRAADATRPAAELSRRNTVARIGNAIKLRRPQSPVATVERLANG
jgi:hypothetical protein